MPTALITGINGQDGSYLAEWLLTQGYRVVGFVRSKSSSNCTRIEHILPRIELIDGSPFDERRFREILELYRPGEIYNLAARASSSQLFSDPLLTGEFNGLAVVRMLETIRSVDPTTRFCQASSREMFGTPTHAPQTESTPFRPRNPYGVAKLFAHGMVGTYRESFGLFACSAILFNHESPRRGPEFVTRKISMGIAQIKEGYRNTLELGDLDAWRDWGYAADYVRAMWLMLQAPSANDYVLATGESHSVREFCECGFSHVGLDYRDYVRTDPTVQRPKEPMLLVGDATRAKTILGWNRTVSFEQLVQMMVDADLARL